MSYAEENGEVMLRMSRSDYQAVILALGIAAGLTSKEGRPAKEWFELVKNRINEGNASYIPYELGKWQAKNMLNYTRTEVQKKINKHEEGG